MFYIKDEKEGKYGVLDTEDNSLDYCSREEIASYIGQGIPIAGVSPINTRVGSRIQIVPLGAKYLTMFNLGAYQLGLDYDDCLFAFNGAKPVQLKGRVRVQSKHVRMLSNYQLGEDLFIFCIEQVNAVKSAVVSKFYKTGVYAFVPSKAQVIALDGMPEFVKEKRVVLKEVNGKICYGKQVYNLGYVSRKCAM